MNTLETYVGSLDADTSQRKDKLGDKRSLEKAGSGSGLPGYLSDVNKRRRIFLGTGRAWRARLYRIFHFVEGTPEYDYLL